MERFPSLHRVVTVLRQLVFTFRLPGLQELMTFSQQFATMLSAGISVLAALEILQRQAVHPRLKAGILAVIKEVERGNTLAAAFSREKELFPSFFISMVEAGEISGDLDHSMHLLALYFQRKWELEQKIKTATAYPKFVILAILVLVFFLLTFILPAFTSVFESLKIELPFATRILLSTGEAMRAYWLIIFMSIIVVYFALAIFLKTKRGSCYRDSVILHLPIVGQLKRKLILARFCRTLSTMLGNGIALLTALEQAKNVVSSHLFGRRIDIIREHIVRGETVAAALKATDFFPMLLISMTNVGEQSGKLEEMLSRAANLFETEVNYAVDRLGSLLEPVLIVFLSLVVGAIVLAVFIPLFTVFEFYL